MCHRNSIFLLTDDDAEQRFRISSPFYVPALLPVLSYVRQLYLPHPTQLCAMPKLRLPSAREYAASIFSFHGQRLFTSSPPREAIIFIH